jgi:DprA winged helix domain
LTAIAGGTYSSEFEHIFAASNHPRSLNRTGALPVLELTDNEQKVVGVLEGEGLTIDDVTRKSGLANSAVSVALLSLEMKR